MSNTAAWINGSKSGGTDGVAPRPFFADRASLFPTELPLTGEVRVAGRQTESIVDGPGLRYVLFTQGCPHHCPGCHNPETHNPDGGVNVPLRVIHEEIRQNPLLRGVTFSGGEPFSRWADLFPLASALRAQGYHTLAYTGYTLEELLNQGTGLPFLSQLDMLVDGPFILAERSLELRFRGSRNQRILDVPASLVAGHAVLHSLQKI